MTIYTKNREKVFVPKVDPRFEVKNESNVAATSYVANNTAIVIDCLNKLVSFYDNFEIDFYCIMSDHVHVIFAFHGNVIKTGAIRSRSYTLGNIIGVLKSITSRNIGKQVWQPNFYEHIIRNEKSLDNIRKYILNNPMVEYENIPWKFIDPS